MREGIDQALIAHVFLDVAAQMTLHALLVVEAPVGKLGDQRGGEHRCGRHEHDHDRHGNRDRQHEHERAHDGHHSGEQLRETLQQAIAHLVDIVDHARDEVAVRVRVDERKRHATEFLARLDAHVAHRLVAETVHAIALQPLERRGADDDKRKHLHQRQQRIEVDAPGIDDEVDTASDQNGRIQLEDHGDGSGDEGDGERDRMRPDI